MMVRAAKCGRALGEGHSPSVRSLRQYEASSGPREFWPQKSTFPLCWRRSRGELRERDASLRGDSRPASTAASVHCVAYGRPCLQRSHCCSLRHRLRLQVRRRGGALNASCQEDGKAQERRRAELAGGCEDGCVFRRQTAALALRERKFFFVKLATRRDS